MIKSIYFKTPCGTNISYQTDFKDLKSFNAIVLDIHYKDQMMEKFNLITIDETVNSSTINLTPIQKTQYDILIDNGMCAKDAVPLSQFTSNLKNMLMLSAGTMSNY